MTGELSTIALGELTFLLSREVSDVAQDCERLQSALSPIFERAGLDNNAIIAMQDLDRMTQVLRDVAAVLATMNPYISGGVSTAQMEDTIRLQSLLDRLTPSKDEKA